MLHDAPLAGGEPTCVECGARRNGKRASRPGASPLAAHLRRCRRRWFKRMDVAREHTGQRVNDSLRLFWAVAAPCRGEVMSWRAGELAPRRAGAVRVCYLQHMHATVW